jgi:hypothetical protein
MLLSVNLARKNKSMSIPGKCFEKAATQILAGVVDANKQNIFDVANFFIIRMPMDKGGGRVRAADPAS